MKPWLVASLHVEVGDWGLERMMTVPGGRRSNPSKGEKAKNLIDPSFQSSLNPPPQDGRNSRSDSRGGLAEWLMAIDSKSIGQS